MTTSAAEASAPPNGATAAGANQPEPPGAVPEAPVAVSATLFGTDDPSVALERAQTAAAALKPILKSQDFTSNIRGKDHVKVEGWQLVGAMFGASAVLVWTRSVTDPAKGWEARFEVHMLDGRVIGAGEAMCDRAEGKWARSDDYAVRSMAQTRATSKALASVFRFIVTLAGYSGTPAEEMPSEGPPESTAKAEPPRPPLPAARVQKIGKGIGALGMTYKDVALMLGAVEADNRFEESSAGIRSALERLTPDQADKVETRLEERAAHAQNGGGGNE